MPEIVFCLAPFSSSIEICKDFLMYKVLSHLIPEIGLEIQRRFGYDCVGNSKLLGNRLYLFHGIKDKTIDIRHSIMIYRNTGCHMTITGHDHQNIYTDTQLWEEMVKIDKTARIETIEPVTL
jgi:hypothetical protein